MNAKISALPILVAIWMITGCGMEQGADDAGFVTLLGDDTLAVESFRHTDDGMEADVVLRTPVTSVGRYRLELDEDGNLVSYTAEIRDPGAGSEDAPRRKETVTPRGDSLTVTVVENGETETHVVAAGRTALPFIDMVHWPFDLMLMRARAADADSITQKLFTTRGGLDFVIRDLGADSMTVTHPFRGTMMVDVDAEGRLERLDAANTTRKLLVERVDAVDIDGLASRFAQLEAEGRAFGPLSGRGEAQAQIDDASIRVDYGQPSKRGRAIWGALVPYGERWRTGANRATHFETDRALQIGELNVPAGTYTLYTVPEEDGGTLIINRQTGQTGTSYDEEMDLGRVPMQRAALEETIEDFTISIEDTDSGGTINLLWDQSRFFVPFTVQQ